MLVGEPMLMGEQIGEEDERQITRLENDNNSSSANEPNPTHAHSHLSGLATDPTSNGK